MQTEISGSESFTRWLVGVGYESKYESIQSFVWESMNQLLSRSYVDFQNKINF